MKGKAKAERLIEDLIRLTEGVSRGKFGNPEAIFELTKTGIYPEKVAALAESFGMMIVKVEAREFQLSQTVQKLRKANRQLEEAKKQLTRENVHLKQEVRKKFSPKRIVGRSPGILEILDKVEKIADTPVTVLITGETGTGKELIAKALHYHSSRSSRPLVALNCTALPENLIESELFGIEKGVATGVDRRVGRIETASGGTLFLDEIGDMPLSTQAKLLRVLEEQEVERVGGRKPIPVDIRIVAATNRDLKERIRKRRFREDLYYRLNVVHLHLPPLRERKDDIPLLLNAFLERHSKILNRGPLALEPDAVRCLTAYPWPGNIRELENEVERAVALAFGETIKAEDLSEKIRNVSNELPEGEPVPTTNLRELEIQAIRKALDETGGNKSAAARLLGLSREGLRKKMNRHRIS